MFRTIRKCTKAIGDSYKQKLTLEQSKATKIKPGNLPIFQYPVSKPGDRRVYVWGLAEHGALATVKRTVHEKNIMFIVKPSRSSFGERNKVRDIACGYGFTVFAVKSDEGEVVYGCGINTDSQIGFVDKEQRLSVDIIVNPRPIPLPLKGRIKVIDLAAGRAHLLILTSEGLFTLGNNSYGQCGRVVIKDENYNKSKVVHHIPNIKGARIVAVTAGQDHSVLLTEAGEVYTCGWGADGQTGLAHYRNEHRPSLVKGDLAGQKIIKVACSSDCVLALSDKGKVFGWGNAEYGQLPISNDNYQVNIAEELEYCQELGHIIDIAAGGTFCMALNNMGDVYVWGYGILGLGPNVERIDKPTLIPATLFGYNPYNKNTKVSKIFCGVSHLAALTNTGDLYTWGNNKFGCLGLGHRDNQYFPLKVAVGAQVEKISCGVDHTVALCKPFV